MKERTAILIVDDDGATAAGLKELLQRSGEYMVHTANSGNDAMRFLNKRSCDILLVDLKLPDCDGMEVMRHAHVTRPGTDVVIITGYGSVESAVECLKKGAYDYLTKPIDTKHFRYFIKKIVEKRNLASENIRLKKKLDETHEYQNIVGNSPLMQDVLEMARQVSRSDVTVLLCGESGTGKELLAHSIHHGSACRHRPLISINCGALPQDLFESELFGHEKGAFTGAYRAKKGALELSDGGTLFLDEIGEMSLKNQVDMLRVLEEGFVRRLGGTVDRPVNVRVIAATNKDLEEEVKKGSFRKDLYYRINVVSIHLPPLRDRLEDLPILIEFFLDRFTEKYSRADLSLSIEAREALINYSWPGNIRELKNCLERAVILSKGSLISPRDFPFSTAGHDLPAGRPGGFGGVSTLAELEKQAIQRALCLCGGHRRKTAGTLGISERTLRNKMKAYHLKPPKRQ